MSKRLYNIFFHTHTVSGIVISVALYVIFLCGAFALFKDEIEVWEKGIPINREKITNLDYDQLISLLKEKEHGLYARDIHITLPQASQLASIRITASKDTLAPKEAKKRRFMYLDTDTFEISSYYQKYSLGNFLYRLHFFSQIPRIGLYLSGSVAFFFLFAIITGVIVHWKKMISNFYLFRPKSKLKTIWSDAHTVLGMIGLPFQFMYAVTSCFLGLSVFVLLPANYIYNNNKQKLAEDLRPKAKTYLLEQKLDSTYIVNPIIKEVTATWDDFALTEVYIKNYGATNMIVQVEGLLNPKNKLLGSGRVTYNVPKQQVTSTKNPYQNDYHEDVEFVVRHLHFADYGGMPLKIIYAILALITCFVIITGVLIWIESRNKKNSTTKQQLYTINVGHIYMAICLSLFPVIAFSFVLARLLPPDLGERRLNVYYTVFFSLWAIVFLFFRYKRDNFFTNKFSFLIGGIIGLIIPIVNGVSSGNWIWKAYLNKEYEILIVDIFWILLSMGSIFIVAKSKRKRPKNKYYELKKIRKHELSQERESRRQKKLKYN
ncbi:PepSY domain-containing protein [Aquimarina sp. I32.4]|uniref:PepSY-associated TM helix domain-containing protein n=1 Tax=Aquimarina sp. I32.4 TaxID=2053903 RepID=UPI000CDE7086|nr:PepSY-associated TM helix domain-containing protein [Aquimarina sp. I32.4]